MSSVEHRTVLPSAVERLVTRADGIYVDATFGRGGHARALLRRLAPAGRLIALDRDPQARAAAEAIGDARLQFVHTRFSELRAVLDALHIAQVDGVLLDLGVSSPQIDEAARGFSWRHAGPLDMRMDTTSGPTLAQWLAAVGVDELTRVIRDYGDERFAAPIAKAIVACRPDARGGRADERTHERPRRLLVDTVELAAVVAQAIPARSRKDAAQHPATRTFQALRIHINQELEELSLVLPRIVQALRAGGRFAVISFHSLEDRIVKRFIDAQAHPERHLGGDAGASRRLPLRAAQLPAPALRALGRFTPDAEEIRANPRARSAVLRLAQRTDCMDRTDRTEAPLAAAPAGRRS
jgi:16S rRNA (cytosine1402-N4)-methyltransferase